MSRYIDADKLKDNFCDACATLKRYGRTVEECRNKTDSYGNKCFKMRLIDAIPTADVVEVVRCRDCKHNRDNGGDCDRTIILNEYDSTEYRYAGLEYCSYGERKEE